MTPVLWLCFILILRSYRHERDWCERHIFIADDCSTITVSCILWISWIWLTRKTRFGDSWPRPTAGRVRTDFPKLNNPWREQKDHAGWTNFCLIWRWSHILESQWQFLEKKHSISSEAWKLSRSVDFRSGMTIMNKFVHLSVSDDLCLSVFNRKPILETVCYRWIWLNNVGTGTGRWWWDSTKISILEIDKRKLFSPLVPVFLEWIWAV
jgi:hypothetical protein